MPTTPHNNHDNRPVSRTEQQDARGATAAGGWGRGVSKIVVVLVTAFMVAFGVAPAPASAESADGLENRSRGYSSHASQSGPTAAPRPGPGHWLATTGPRDYRDTAYEEELRNQQDDGLWGPRNVRRNDNLNLLRVGSGSAGKGGFSLPLPVPTGTVNIAAYGSGRHISGVESAWQSVTQVCNWRLDVRFTPTRAAEDGPSETDAGPLVSPCSRTGDRIVRYDRDLPPGELCTLLYVENAFREAACVSITQ